MVDADALTTFRTSNVIFFYHAFVDIINSAWLALSGIDMAMLLL